MSTLRFRLAAVLLLMILTTNVCVAKKKVKDKVIPPAVDKPEVSAEQLEGITSVLNSIKESGLLGEDETESLQNILEIANLDFSEISAKSAEMEVIKDNYKQKLVEMKELHDEMSVTQEALEGERAQLQQDLQQVTVLEAEKTSLQEKVEQLMKDKSEMSTKITKLEKQSSEKSTPKCDSEALTALAARVQQESAAEFTAVYKNYLSQLSELHQQLDAKEDLLESGTYDAVMKRKLEHITFLSQVNQRLQESVNRQQSLCREKMSPLQQEVEQLQRVGPDADLVAQLQGQNKQLTADITSCKGTKTLLNDRYEELKEINSGTARSQSHWHQKALQCGKNNTDLTHKNLALIEDNSQLKLELQKLHSQLQDHPVTGDELVEAEEIKRQKSEVWKRDQKIKSVKVYLDKCNDHLDTQISFTKELEEVHNANLNEMVTCKQALEEKEAFSKELEKKHSAHIEEATKCSGALKERDTHLTKQEVKLNNLQSKYDDCLKQLSNNKLINSDMTDEAKTLTRQINKLEGENKALTERVQMYKTRSLECCKDKSVCENLMNVMKEKLARRDETISEVSYNCSRLAWCQWDLNFTSQLHNKSLEDCKCEAVEKENEDGVMEIVGYKSRYQTECNASKVELSDQVKQLSASSRMYQQQVTEYKQLLNQAEGQLKAEAKVKDMCQLQVEKLKEKLAEGGEEKETQSLQDSINNCQATLQIIREKSVICKSDLEVLENQQQTLLSEQAVWKSDADDCKITKEQLRISKATFKKAIDKKDQDFFKEKQYLHSQIQHDNSDVAYYRWYFYALVASTLLLLPYSAWSLGSRWMERREAERLAAIEKKKQSKKRR